MPRSQPAGEVTRQSELVDATEARYRFRIASVARQTRVFFRPQDVSSDSKWRVLGKTVSDTLFGPDVDPTGQMIRIRNQPFKVIGVMDTKGQAAMGNDQDDVIFAPYTTVQKRLQGQQNIQTITISATSPEATTQVADAVASVMLRTQAIPGNGDFTIGRKQEIDDIRQQRSIDDKYLAGISGFVSLIVGGIGITNIMSCRSRTHSWSE